MRENYWLRREAERERARRRDLIAMVWLYAAMVALLVLGTLSGR